MSKKLSDILPSLDNPVYNYGTYFAGVSVRRRTDVVMTKTKKCALARMLAAVLALALFATPTHTSEQLISDGKWLYLLESGDMGYV